MKEFIVKFSNTNDIVIFTKIADEFKENIDVRSHDNHYVVDAKSIMGLLSLGIPKEIFIVIHTNNKDVISKFEEDISKWKVEE